MEVAANLNPSRRMNWAVMMPPDQSQSMSKRLAMSNTLARASGTPLQLKE
jgi:hypothetical protein